jgi:hypothetical protein
VSPSGGGPVCPPPDPPLPPAQLHARPITASAPTSRIAPGVRPLLISKPPPVRLPTGRSEYRWRPSFFTREEGVCSMTRSTCGDRVPSRP